MKGFGGRIALFHCFFFFLQYKIPIVSSLNSHYMKHSNNKIKNKNKCRHYKKRKARRKFRVTLFGMSELHQLVDFLESVNKN